MARLLRARQLRPGDGKVVGSLMRRITPLHRDVLENLEERLEILIGEGSAIGAIVEEIDRRSQSANIVGTTMLGFVHDDFVTRYFENPEPALCSSALRSVSQNSFGCFMSRKEQARANLGDGMQQIIIEFAIDPMDMQHPDFAPVMNELYSAYFKFERGYNIKGVFVEAQVDLEPLVVGSGLFPIKYMDIGGTNQDIVIPLGASTKRGLYRVTRADKSRLPPSSAAFVVMTYIAPTFQFTPHEQRLLGLAIEGLTDQDISAALDVSRDALKQTWRTIYDHVGDIMPELFATNNTLATSGRGTEKRRFVISHVHENPQELRPHHLRRG
jgi:hypothetical protein